VRVEVDWWWFARQHWALFALFAAVALYIVVRLVLRRMQTSEQQERVRGFEVKPTSGPTPEQREREAYHG